MQPSNKPSSSCAPLVWIGTRAAARRVCYYYCGSLETENTHITAKELMTVFPYWGKKRNTAIKKIQRFTSSHTRMNDATAVFCFFVADMGIYVNSRGSLINMKLWHEVQEGALNELKFNYLITCLSRTLPQPWLLSTEGTWFSEGADAVPANLDLSKFKTVLSRWQPYTYSSVLPFFLSSEALVNSRACIRLPPFWYHETQIHQHV